MPVKDPRPAMDLYGLPAGAVAEPVSEGYINDTYRILLAGEPAYILQRINTHVFPDPGPLMENVERVLPALRDPAYHVPELVRTPSGTSWAPDASGNTWRLYRFIPGSSTLPSGTPGVAFETGRILSVFHRLLESINPDDMHTTLPRFHDLDWRMEQLEAAAREGYPERLGEGAGYLDLSRKLAARCAVIPWGRLPLRVCHNDPKLSNVLFDRKSEKALCLIDLDTLMPGFLLHDFGDAARSLVYPWPEDRPGDGEWEPDLAAFAEFCRGFAYGGLRLHPQESAFLPVSLVLMPLLHGVRALADYFLGDRYYKVTDPGQNLRRARNLIGQAGQAAGRLEELKGILGQFS